MLVFSQNYEDQLAAIAVAEQKAWVDRTRFREIMLNPLTRTKDDDDAMFIKVKQFSIWAYSIYFEKFDL